MKIWYWCLHSSLEGSVHWYNEITALFCEPWTRESHRHKHPDCCNVGYTTRPDMPLNRWCVCQGCVCV